MNAHVVFALALLSTCGGLPASAQNGTDLPAPADPPSSQSNSGSLAAPLRSTGSSRESACNQIEMQFAKTLTFRQRACFYAARLIAPSTALHGAFIAGFGQLRNSPFISHEDFDDFGHRVSVFYAQRFGQSAGEMLAGYWHREDPRARTLIAHGFWNRTRAALTSVLVAKDSDGNTRPQLAPIAGALGSGMASMGLYRKNNGLAVGFERSGLTFGCYFATAIAHEFHPDLNAIAARLLHRPN